MSQEHESPKRQRADQKLAALRAAAEDPAEIEKRLQAARAAFGSYLDTIEQPGSSALDILVSEIAWRRAWGSAVILCLSRNHAPLVQHAAGLALEALEELCDHADELLAGEEAAGTPQAVALLHQIAEIIDRLSTSEKARASIEAAERPR